MSFTKAELPTNRTFGFFFTVVFFVLSVYTYYLGKVFLANFSGSLGAIFLLLTIFRVRILFPLNKLWMRLGFLLGMVVNPVIMGIIFFGVFTPVGMVIRLFGRDELHLKNLNQSTKWIDCKNNKTSGTFKNQF